MKIKTLLLSLILLAPLFFGSVSFAAQEQKKIDLTPEQQNKVDRDLYGAMVNDNFDNVIAALNAGADIKNTKLSSYSCTRIGDAARFCCHPNIFKVLFSHGANPQIQTPESNQNLLHQLLESPYNSKPHFFETIKTLLQHKVSLHLNDDKNNTPLHLATKIYKLCAAYSKEPNTHVSWQKNLPIFYRVIELFLFAGADHKKTNNKNKTALDLIDQEHQAPIERLINIANFFNLNLSKNLPDLLLSHIAVPGVPTIILDYIDPLYADKNSHPTEEEQKLWDELAPIRTIQQELLLAPPNGLPTEEKKQ